MVLISAAIVVIKVDIAFMFSSLATIYVVDCYPCVFIVKSFLIVGEI